jgi:hypothetical protein
MSTRVFEGSATMRSQTQIVFGLSQSGQRSGVVVMDRF